MESGKQRKGGTLFLKGQWDLAINWTRAGKEMEESN